MPDLVMRKLSALISFTDWMQACQVLRAWRSYPPQTLTLSDSDIWYRLPAKVRVPTDYRLLSIDTESGGPIGPFGACPVLLRAIPNLGLSLHYVTSVDLRSQCSSFLQILQLLSRDWPSLSSLSVRIAQSSNISFGGFCPPKATVFTVVLPKLAHVILCIMDVGSLYDPGFGSFFALIGSVTHLVLDTRHVPFVTQSLIEPPTALPRVIHLSIPPQNPLVGEQDLPRFFPNLLKITWLAFREDVTLSLSSDACLLEFCRLFPRLQCLSLAPLRDFGTTFFTASTLYPCLQRLYLVQSRSIPHDVSHRHISSRNMSLLFRSVPLKVFVYCTQFIDWATEDFQTILSNGQCLSHAFTEAESVKAIVASSGQCPLLGFVQPINEGYSVDLPPALATSVHGPVQFHQRMDKECETERKAA
ncbi:unnamed protein product [Dibothriocephalus latus]|uniref:F-box domain-containing protein n=1 Tax=Dibothriocephalus latus TaxID=60516 RepID=A0A3P7LBS3_DIBLA|nr:unnamed protein product [Dibothriocephalus latus]